MRYWQVERDCGSCWVPTDFRVSGGTPSEAAAECERIATANGWTARLGREVAATEHYCDFAWVGMS